MAEASKAVRKRAKRKLSLSKAQEATEDAEDRERLNAKTTAATKKLYLAKLKLNGGFITKTAEDIGISRRTAEKWRKSDADFNEQVLTILAIEREWVASKIRTQIDQGNFAAMKFYMNCKGGGVNVPEEWVERREITGSPDAPLRIEARIETVREETTDKALIAALAKAMQYVPDLFSDGETEGKD